MWFLSWFKVFVLVYFGILSCDSITKIGQFDTRLSDSIDSFQEDYHYQGMLDRIEDGDLAVVLIEEIQQEIILPFNNLPEGVQEGMWLIVTFDHLAPYGVHMLIDQLETDLQKQYVYRLLKSLH